MIHSSMLRLKKDLRVEQEIDGKEVESQTRQEESKNFILLVLIVFELGSICHDTFVQFLFRSVEGVRLCGAKKERREGEEKGRREGIVVRKREQRNPTYPIESSLLESIPAQVSG